MVRVKICGMTSLADAQTAVLYGADALGFIFYEKSPRVVSVQKVKEIIQALSPFVLTVGVFVNETAETIRETVRQCGLSLVQLHGDESPEFCGKLDLRIIKAIRVSRLEDLKRIEEYDVQGILLDAYHPDFYGGTGRTIDWEILRSIVKNRSSEQSEREGEAPEALPLAGGDASPYYEKPIILSGGLTPENVRQAIQTVSPYGLDVCTGVEEKPGKKSPEKIRLFIKNAKENDSTS